MKEFWTTKRILAAFCILPFSMYGFAIYLNFWAFLFTFVGCCLSVGINNVYKDALMGKLK